MVINKWLFILQNIHVFIISTVFSKSMSPYERREKDMIITILWKKIFSKNHDRSIKLKNICNKVRTKNNWDYKKYYEFLSV